MASSKGARRLGATTPDGPRTGQTRRASFVGVAVACAFSVFGAACGSDTPSVATRYSGDDWAQGVDIAVEDAVGAVDAATAFFPDKDGYLFRVNDFAADAESNPVGVLHRRDGGLGPEDRFDAVVLYRDGPFCGLVPDVAVEGDTRELVVTTTSVIEPDCAAAEYAAAIGLVLADEYQDATIVATHSRETKGRRRR